MRYRNSFIYNNYTQRIVGGIFEFGIGYHFYGPYSSSMLSSGTYYWMISGMSYSYYKTGIFQESMNDLMGQPIKINQVDFDYWQQYNTRTTEYKADESIIYSIQTKQNTNSSTWNNYSATQQNYMLNLHRFPSFSSGERPKLEESNVPMF